MIIKEACCENYMEAIKAEALGANRIELCSNLDVGGLSPSLDEIKNALNFINIPLFVMLRLRAGDFVYTKKEKNIMIQDLKLFKSLGVNGIVVGAINKRGDIDREFLKELIKVARPLEITFHKAIDELKDYNRGIEDLIELGVDRVLTSGKKENIEDSIGFLRSIKRNYGEHIKFVGAGKISKNNLDSIHNKLNFEEYHGKLIVGYLA